MPLASERCGTHVAHQIECSTRPQQGIAILFAGSDFRRPRGTKTTNTFHGPQSILLRILAATQLNCDHIGQAQGLILRSNICILLVEHVGKYLAPKPDSVSPSFGTVALMDLNTWWMKMDSNCFATSRIASGLLCPSLSNFGTSADVARPGACPKSDADVVKELLIYMTSTSALRAPDFFIA